MKQRPTASEAAAAIRSGTLTSLELVEQCIARIEELEDTVQAWAFFDPSYALRQAREADRLQQAKGALGPLHGIPVGIKDIFDTSDMPTENGTVLHAGRTPVEDAATVALLRAAGAVIMGKTVTTELAVYSPGKTRNPRNTSHTPGGSSSGSAAAVAADMIPLAIGSQTNGSVIRPAAYCGVCGYKPTQGLVSLYGALAQSRHLDTIGVFARSVEDLALIAEQLMVYDGRDPNQRQRARANLVDTVAQPPPAPPQIAFVKTPIWPRADAETQEAFIRLAQQIGSPVTEVVLPDSFDRAIEWHGTIMQSDLAKSFAREYERGRDRLSSTLRNMIENGQKILAVDYNVALEHVRRLNRDLQRIFASYDVILTPATTGTAPHGLESTGSPVFCTIWTLTGLPAVSVPLLNAANGLPLGVQLVSAKGDDARLLRTARWLAEHAMLQKIV
jgi:Asp-tRNA(Asn)/Glu-tRNA(Gln) amidotransferase A subunit family amidase